MTKKICIHLIAFTILAAIFLLSHSVDLLANSPEGIITTLTQRMVQILNVVIVAVMAWSGFLIARGDSSAFQRIIYGVIGLVIVNSAEVIVNFFKNP